VLLLLGACGGAAEGNPDSESGGAAQGGLPGAGGSSAGKGGAGSGGMQGTPTKGGAPGNGGAASGGAGSGGATGGCCLAIAICDDGDRELKDGEVCNPDAGCYTRTICCSTIRCVRDTPQCDAIPTCDPGDKQIMGECPPSLQCYSRSLCGNTVNCVDTACDPATEHNRKYVATSPEKCALIDFSCPANTQYFGNDCGCGCEQDSSCPEFVNCQPRIDDVPLSPLCSDKLTCPYTQRPI